jgi:hypothetical protein
LAETSLFTRRDFGYLASFRVFGKRVYGNTLDFGKTTEFVHKIGCLLLE